jgi:hypothetical protein
MRAYYDIFTVGVQECVRYKSALTIGDQSCLLRVGEPRSNPSPSKYYIQVLHPSTTSKYYEPLSERCEHLFADPLCSARVTALTCW